MISNTGLPVSSRPSEEARLTAQDQSLWFDGFTAMLRSHVAFLIADYRGDADVVSRAANVLAWRNGRFSTVRELVEVCASHRWNTLIYEAWTWETGNRVRTLIHSLGVTAAQAVEIYARHLGYFDVAVTEMEDALHDARTALEGDSWWQN